MKKIILLFILVLSLTANAQPPHRDTTMVGFVASTNALTTSPIIRGTRMPAELTAIHQRFCFDMSINMEMVLAGGHRMEQCLFINNTDGYVGYTPGQFGGGGPVEIIMPEIPTFVFTIFGFKGNVYSYHNEKGKHDIIEHWVMTGNTQEHKYQLNDAMMSAPVERKDMQRTYCDGKALATAYKLPDQPTLWYLYGNRYPPQLHIRKYFGAFGVGVVRADEGIYVLMEVVAGSTTSTIKSINQAMNCFDPSEFKEQESEFRVKRRADLDAEAQRIERHAEQAANANTCQSERMAIVNFEREQNRLAYLALDSTNHGNTYQDRTTQNAFMGMMDPLPMVQGAILSCNLNICTGTNAMATHPTEETQQRLNCNSALLQRLVLLSQQMRDLDRRYASSPAVALTKKSQLYLAAMREGSCN